MHFISVIVRSITDGDCDGLMTSVSVMGGRVYKRRARDEGTGRTLDMTVTVTDSRVTSLTPTLMITRKIRTRGAGPVCHKPVKTSQDTSMRMTAITCVDTTGAERYNNDD